MPKFEQARAPKYPEDQSIIEFDLTDCGMLETDFKFAIEDHGNDDQHSWPSYMNDGERFTVKREGKSIVSPDKTDFIQTHIWSIKFDKRQKTLLMDMGANTVQRFEGEFTVPATNEDVSDIAAAYFNYHAFVDERRAQGWEPYLDQPF